MKFLPLLLAIALISCDGGNQEGHGEAISTPIDSTKLTGAAPVQYGAENPADDTAGTTDHGESMIQNNDGLSNRRTQSGVSGGPVQQQEQGTSPGRARGTGQNVSNTTDARTTGGSAQGSPGNGTGNTGGR